MDKNENELTGSNISIASVILCIVVIGVALLKIIIW